MPIETLYTLALEYPPKHDNNASIHDYHEIAYIIKGAGTVELHSKSYAVMPDSIIVIPRTTHHRELAGKTGLTVLFTGIIIKDDKIILIPAVITDPAFALVYLFRSILEEMHAKNTAIIQHYVSIAAMKLDRILNEKPADTNTSYIDDSIDFMKKNFAKEFDIADISRRYSLNKNYFTTKFREKTGRSPVKFLNELRIDVAQRLLMSGESVQETAVAVGCQDPYYFSRLFKKITGVPPQKFKDGVPAKKSNH
ncbi:MAG: helix-turn-helix transcriptional regulator [Spirochaetes bacterium]|nr:helix-turn-helix transcriptional regulator [Spirochaetota bacterium]